MLCKRGHYIVYIYSCVNTWGDGTPQYVTLRVTRCVYNWWRNVLAYIYIPSTLKTTQSLFLNININKRIQQTRFCAPIDVCVYIDYLLRVYNVYVIQHAPPPVHSPSLFNHERKRGARMMIKRKLISRHKRQKVVQLPGVGIQAYIAR